VALDVVLRAEGENLLAEAGDLLGGVTARRSFVEAVAEEEHAIRLHVHHV